MDMIGFKGILFIIMALFAVISSLFMVTRKNPVHSALWMIVTFFAMAVIYLLLNAQFIAVAQVMVYAGAIMMLILFVIMMVQMEKTDQSAADQARRSSISRIAGALFALILLVEMLFGFVFSRMTGKAGDYPPDMVHAAGNVKTVGSLLYGQYLFPFEIASLLLLVGIVGAVVIVKRK